MKKYNPKKWADLKAQVQWNEKYGENAGAARRTETLETPTKFSFPHLLHVRYEVAQHNLRKFPEDPKGNPGYNPFALPYDKEGQYHKTQQA